MPALELDRRLEEMLDRDGEKFDLVRGAILVDDRAAVPADFLDVALIIRLKDL